jgi:arylsulfatase A-like enzyme
MDYIYYSAGIGKGMSIRIKALEKLCILLALGCWSCADPTSKGDPQSPNIILIMTDDQGWYDAGFNGNKEIRTPNMDLLASKGIIFNRFYSASAVCSPTRASVLTGRNPLRMNIPTANSGHMIEDEITLPEILLKAGYVNGHFGKWHLGTLSRTALDANRGGRPEHENNYSIPTEHGYDQFFCTESKVPTYDPMLKPADFKEGESLRYGWRAIKPTDSTQVYGTAYWEAENQKAVHNLGGDDSRVIMDRVIPFIEKSHTDGRPFFSTIWFHTPHLPVVCDSVHAGYFKDLALDKQLYYGTIAALDEQIGRLWKSLGEYGIQEETIIFFCSDNGPERATPGSAGDFRERKRSLYEGGIRVPAFVIWKGHFEGGRRIDFPAVTSDYLPTILDILDMDYPDDRPLDGTSLLSALTAGQNERNKPIGFIFRQQVSWVTDHHKLIGDAELKDFELYDLINDKSEKEDIIKVNPELAEKLTEDLTEWLHSVESSKEGMDYN